MRIGTLAKIRSGLLACTFLLTASADGGEDTPLDRYVAAFDPQSGPHRSLCHNNPDRPTALKTNPQLG
jgi:hypothetical protein